MLGVDSGGTFTDFFLSDKGQLRIHKVLSTPYAPEAAILQGITELGLAQQPLTLIHGSTVATNAVLEGKGVRTLYITNRGMGDLLTIGRQTRRELYNLQPQPLPPPVDDALIHETGGRISATGEILEPLTEADLTAISAAIINLKPAAVAINLLFSFVDDRYERLIASTVQRTAEQLGYAVFCSRSSALLAEIREYERGITTWLNAWIGPLVAGYLQRLQQALPEATISVMQSNAMTMATDEAADAAVRLLLSGPAGGLQGARAVAALAGIKRMLTFDMGGTSTDVAAIDGELLLTTQSLISHYPVAIPMVAMHTIGAGGGSLAHLDSGGMLHVGPASAGADPGPACYGRGGSAPTVTDAHLILGRLPRNAALGGKLLLDYEAAVAAITPLANDLTAQTSRSGKEPLVDAAAAIISVVNEAMARALRVISIDKGLDPRDATLVSFGGAGGLHVCDLATALGMQQAFIPVHAGVLSALGMVSAPRGRELSQTVQQPLNQLDTNAITHQFDQLIAKGRQALAREGLSANAVTARCRIDLRYRNQSHTLALDWPQPSTSAAAAAFHQLHQQRYGHQMQRDIEVATLRLHLATPTRPLLLPTINGKEATPATLIPSAEHHLCHPLGIPHWQRDKLVAEQQITGPAIISEAIATTYIAPRWHCRVDSYGNLHLHQLTANVSTGI
ncbi:MAG: hydantoinase/oxoprolinase family protein [Gammaproteobacteria bacterium]|nr:hydantoinase/oxoprolinase family protein [Gammaproteobacteria bacterium]